MRKISIISWLRNVSIARKLYFTVGIMAMLIAMELMTLLFAINTLSSVRALVGAEGLWSKAQKDAVYHLEKYAISHNEKDYQTYLNFLKVNLGDRKTRLELMKKDPDLNVARQGFLEGRFHPDDINGPIRLLRRFNKISYISHAIETWSKGDSMIYQVQAIGDSIHAEIQSPAPSQQRITEIMQKIDPINNRLTLIEDDFSYTLGAGSRWLTDIILKLLLSLVFTVEVTGLSVTIFVSRGISRGLNAIIGSAKRIAIGDFSVRAKAFSKDEIGSLAHSFNDMTDKLEQNITALKESEIALQNAKEVAENALVIKDHFLANMSHEIRTPMNAIIGFTNLLEVSQLNEEQRQFVEAIKVSGQNLTVIINDILDYSKIKAGMITLEKAPININAILESIYILLKPKANDKNIKLIYQVNPAIPQTVIGDSTRLTQIISNLVDNALKFTEDGYVEISARTESETREFVSILFTIKDTGKGIPLDKQAIVFERFTQATEDTTRRYGGTGLGLSIVKSLVDLFGGTINLQSRPDQGTIFSVVITFPRSNVQSAAPVETSKPIVQEEEKSSNIRILYIEDNTLNQKLLLHFSRKFGFDIEFADNGRIGIDKLQEKNYDLVLMDIQMPEMDGYEATRTIRNELKSNIPIIAITAHAMSGEREKCLNAGMNDFISKPFEPKDLNDKILKYCKT